MCFKIMTEGYQTLLFYFENRTHELHSRFFDENFPTRLKRTNNKTSTSGFLNNTSSIKVS